MILEQEGAGGEIVLFKQLGGRCTVLRVSLCLEMVPSTAEVPWSDVNRAVDLEHREGLV